MFSSKDLRRLIIPLILEQLLAVSIGIADTAMVSTAGEAAVSGISLVDSISILLINIFTALATGGAVVATQYLGSKNEEKARDCAKQLELTVFCISGVIALLCAVLRGPLLRLIYGQIEPDVFSSAQIYFLTVAFSYPLLGVYSAGAALFRVMTDSRTPLLVSVGMNVLNVAGNALFIYGFHWGAMGAGLGTLLSRLAGAAVITALLLQKHRVIYIQQPLSLKPDFAVIKKLLRIGVPGGIENGLFQMGKLLVAGMVATFGTAAITANAVANNLASLQIIPGAAIGTAMITVTGRYMGAGDTQGAKKATNRLLLLSYIVTEVMILWTALLRGKIIGVYELSAQTAALASQMFLIHSLGAVPVWPLSFTLPNALRAAGDVKYTMTVSVLFVFLFRVAFSYLLAFPCGLGVMGIWYGMQVDWLMRGIFFTGRYIRGRWQTKKVI